MSDKKPIEMNLRKLIEKSGKTRREIAKELGCDVSTVTKHYNENRNIRSDFIIKYANYFNVSADYLLGLSKAWTPDNKLNFVCNYTGLSENFMDDFLYKELEIRDYLLNFLNSIANDEDLSNAFDSLLWYLNDYINAVEKLRGIINNNMSRPYKEVLLDKDIQLAISKAFDEKDISKFRVEDLFKRIIQIYSGENEISDFTFYKQRG